MNFRSNIFITKINFLIVVLVFSFFKSEAQQTPLNSISYWLFTPYLSNPAMVGSKDFLSIDLNASFKGNYNSQILSGNTRLSKTSSGYFSSPDILEFKNLGFGGSIFHDIRDKSKNTGFSGAVSYQLPLNTRKLSYLSFGASLKGVYNVFDNDTIDPGYPAKKTFYPNVDLGIYYYGTNFFSGVSVTNLFRNSNNTDSLGIDGIPVYRHYFLTAGYKILLSRSMNIVLEPSIVINTYDSTFKKIQDNINPMLKLYVENFCIGSYFLTKGSASFFFQFRYPRFYVGAFYELPKKTAYYKNTPVIEFTFGINIQHSKSRLSNPTRW